MSEALVDLVIEAEDWLDALPDLSDAAEQAARAALEAIDLDPGTFSIALLACDDGRIATLNADFRDKPVPTNVLSWPSFPLAPPAPGEAPPGPPESAHPGPIPLGDVAIALQTCVREAQEAGRPLKNHCIHLILHACLHLAGYDHQTVPDAELMEGIERAALAGLDIPHPYV